MCELFAMNFNNDVTPRFTFKGFIRRGIVNPDGWGIACYHEGNACICKEPINAAYSKLAESIREDPSVKSKVIIAHVRLSSVGKNSLKNTLLSFVMDGRVYVFAHNGTVSNYEKLSLGGFSPLGETDSEHLFCLFWQE
jgi:glutamine amidotransferase